MTMAGCSAPNCTNSSSKGHRLYRFPTDIARRAIWLQNCRRDKWIPTSTSRLCAAHFEETQWELERADNWIKLKPNAVPTLFNVPNPNIKESKFKMPGGSICSVAVCKSNSKKAKKMGENLMFFTFPKDPKVRKEWITNCYREEKFNAKCKRICSKHFKVEDYEDALQAKLMDTHPKKLKKTAIPSLHVLPSEASEIPSSSKDTEYDLMKTKLEKLQEENNLLKRKIQIHENNEEELKEKNFKLEMQLQHIVNMKQEQSYSF